MGSQKLARQATTFGGTRECFNVMSLFLLFLLPPSEGSWRDRRENFRVGGIEC